MRCPLQIAWTQLDPFWWRATRQRDRVATLANRHFETSLIFSSEERQDMWTAWLQGGCTGPYLNPRCPVSEPICGLTVFCACSVALAPPCTASYADLVNPQFTDHTVMAGLRGSLSALPDCSPCWFAETPTGLIPLIFTHPKRDIDYASSSTSSSSLPCFNALLHGFKARTRSPITSC